MVTYIYIHYIVVGFWGFGEQYVTERSTFPKTLRIALLPSLTP